MQSAFFLIKETRVKKLISFFSPDRIERCANSNNGRGACVLKLRWGCHTHSERECDTAVWTFYFVIRRHILKYVCMHMHAHSSAVGSKAAKL